jgi:glycosyltransferase involved in cell wall biosynthesis
MKLHKKIKSVHFTENTGYGHALSLLFNIAHKNHFQYMITLDGDGQHDPEEIPVFLEALKEADIVIGNRFMSTSTDGLPLYRRLGIKILGKLLGIGDAQNGFRAYNRKAITSLNPREKGMGASIEILKLAKACALKIKEVPCSVTYADVRHSKNPLIHGKELLKTLFFGNPH